MAHRQLLYQIKPVHMPVVASTFKNAKTAPFRLERRCTSLLVSTHTLHNARHAGSAESTVNLLQKAIQSCPFRWRQWAKRRTTRLAFDNTLLHQQVLDCGDLRNTRNRLCQADDRMLYLARLGNVACRQGVAESSVKFGGNRRRARHPAVTANRHTCQRQRIATDQHRWPACRHAMEIGLNALDVGKAVLDAEQVFMASHQRTQHFRAYVVARPRRDIVGVHR